MVHNNKKMWFKGLKIDEKIWSTQKCSEAEKLTSKKKLVERKLISASTGCNGAYPYMASQEVVFEHAGKWEFLRAGISMWGFPQVANNGWQRAVC